MKPGDRWKQIWTPKYMTRGCVQGKLPLGEVSSEGGAIRSLSEMGVMLTMLTTGIKPGAMGAMGPAKPGDPANPGAANSSKTDVLVMETKAKIIEILQFILDVRLDYRITSLLSILKERVVDSERDSSGRGGGIRGIDLEVNASLIELSTRRSYQGAFSEYCEYFDDSSSH